MQAKYRYFKFATSFANILFSSLFKIVQAFPTKLKALYTKQHVRTVLEQYPLIP